WSAKHAEAPDISDWMAQQLRYTFQVWGLLAAAVSAVLRAELHRFTWRWTLGFGAGVAMVCAAWNMASFIGAPGFWSVVVVGLVCLGSGLLLLFGEALARRPRQGITPLARLPAGRLPRSVRSAAAWCIVTVLVCGAASTATLQMRQYVLGRMAGGVGRFLD